MPAHHSTCNKEQIGRYLRQALSTIEEREFELHLDSCADCRDLLEQTAAESRWWDHASVFLKDDPWDSDYGASGEFDPETTQESSPGPAIIKHLAPTDDPRMLGRFGGYEIVGVVGSGGMGVVLKGFEVALNRYVAIKVLAPHLASRASARQRFAREAQAAAAVVHDNVIAIHGVSEANGLPFLVMPYVRGPSLQKRLDEQGALGVAEVLRIGTQVAAGLAAAHAQGLVHRDIKPANIMLDDGVERVTITDFGLARAADDASLTRTGVIAGTPLFMSPEQARGDTVDHRSDLFSLGSVLYTACTGRPPFHAENTFGVLRRITDSPPRRIREIEPETPEWLCGIIDKLLAKDCSRRFQSAAEVAKLLEQCLAHVQQPDTSPLPEGVASPAPDTKANVAKRTVIRFRVALFVVGAVLLAGSGIYLSRNWHTEPPLGPPPVQNGRDSSDAAAIEPPDWQDGAEQALQELDRDSAALEIRSGRLWDDEEYLGGEEH